MMPELGMDMFDTHMPFEADPQMQPAADAMVEVPQDQPEQPMHPEQPEELMTEPGNAHIAQKSICYVTAVSIASTVES